MTERAAWTAVGVALIIGLAIAGVVAIAKGPHVSPAERAACVERVVAAEQRDRPPRSRHGITYWTTGSTSAAEVCSR